MTQINKILKAYYNGDSISDRDLLALHDHTLQTANYLSHMGDRFRLACTEALRISDACAGYLQARDGVNFVRKHLESLQDGEGQ